MDALIRDEARALSRTLAANAKTLGGTTALLWAIEVVDLLLGHGLDAYGVVPRTWSGLWGIVWSPFLHAGFGHLAVNTVSLWILGGLAMVRRQRDFWFVGFVAAVFAGLGAWVFGGPNTVHIGASGVIFGYLGFLLARGLFERSIGAVALSLGVLWLAGGMLFGVFPGMNAGISWQAHLFGFIGGVVAARALANGRDPRTRIGQRR